MSDFGYTGNEEHLIYDYVRQAWRDGDGNLRDLTPDEVTPVQVVAPGQVAVDATDLRVAATLLGRYGECELSTRLLRAALAATEPAPDSEQGETGKPKWADLFGIDQTYSDDQFEQPYEPCVIGSDGTCKRGAHDHVTDTPAASGGGTEADDHECDSGYFDRSICHACGAMHSFCSSCGYLTDGTDCEFYVTRPSAKVVGTPAAEPGRVEVNSSGQAIGGSDGQPQRVTLPDPTPPIVWTAADDEPWRPERITFNDAEYVRAQPPTPDPAETDAPHGPTLAAVARALYVIVGRCDADTPMTDGDLADLAVHIEREAGGDGHE